MKKEVYDLYRDALFSRLIREGYSEYAAEVECRRRLQKINEF